MPKLLMHPLIAALIILGGAFVITTPSGAFFGLPFFTPPTITAQTTTTTSPSFGTSPGTTETGLTTTTVPQTTTSASGATTTTPPSTTTTTVPCTDSDGGINIQVKGTTTDARSSLSDWCNSNTEISEFYCSNNKVTQTNITCTNGCSNGACAQGMPLPSGTTTTIAPKSITVTITNILSSLTDFFGKIFSSPNLIISDAKFSGDNLQVTIINNGKVAATFSSDIIEVYSLDFEINTLCQASGNFCVDRITGTGSLSCSGRGGQCAVRGAGSGHGQCACIFRKIGTSESIKLGAGESTTITIENVGAPSSSTDYIFTIKSSGNIKGSTLTKTVGP